MMSVSDSDLDDALRKEIEKLLNEAAVYNFGAYGWLDAYTADPEYIGHAMWQVEPSLDFDSFNGDRQPQAAIPDWQQWLAISGADLVGLMNAARMSIGLFLFQAKLSEGALFNTEFYDLHQMSAIIYLATASERLREFFIAAAFRKSKKAYNKGVQYKGQERGGYVIPFEEAKDSFALLSDELLDPLKGTSNNDEFFVGLIAGASRR
jgi:hypothetical protein